jgi:hypothetical protein
MKTNLKNTLMVAAGLLTLGATAAYGQETLKANVPFSFRTAAGVQPAGQYEVSTVKFNGTVATIRNLGTQNSTFAGFGIPEGVSRDQHPRLVFRCGNESGCALTAVWLDGDHGLKYKVPHLKPSELERISVVYLHRDAGE